MEAFVSLDDDDDVRESSFYIDGSGNLDAKKVGGAFAAASSSSSSIFMEKPPPPFVWKTYNMVSDHTTDSIISWSSTGTSLIVWDPHRFAAELMPRHFRHNNFSTFVCQLNTYGFKKISWDKWEFQNEWFQKGKPSWLQNVKRKTGNRREVKQPKEDAEPTPQMTMLEADQKLENLKNEQNVLNEEIKTLKKKLQDAEKELETIKTEMQINTRKQRKMIMAIAQAFPEARKEWGSNGGAKKPRLMGREKTDTSLEGDDDSEKPGGDNNNIVILDDDYDSPDNQTETGDISGDSKKPGGDNNIVISDYDDDSPDNQKKIRDTSGDPKKPGGGNELETSDHGESPDNQTETRDISGPETKKKKDDINADAGRPHIDNEKHQQMKKLLMNDMNIENVAAEGMAMHQSKIVIELEDLLGERTDWAAYVKELGDKASCLQVLKNDVTGYEE